MKVGAIALGLTVAAGANAETPREELVHSYHLLQKADRDYAGHKAKAMEAEAAAGHDLGLDLGGALPDAERQWKSDQQLAEARRLAREARDKLEARDRERAADHLDSAIKELDAALEVK
jgi:hypothetical protein